jgi:flagellar basal body rod protein FlgG
MNYGLYLSAAGLKAQDARQAVIANNIANAKTTGFKRDLVLMQSRANAVVEDPTMARYRVPVVDNQGGGVNAIGGGIDLTQGELKSTGKATDLALSGQGFFTVRGANDSKLLTRDGSFNINQDNNLVTANGGNLVLDQAGQPIVLDPTMKITVSSQGEIMQSDSLAGGGVKLGIVDVPDTRQIIKLGGNLMSVRNPDSLTPASPQTTVVQGHLEDSDVDPTVEMVNMITGMRAFEANAKMISYADTAMSEINTVGRVA